MYKKRFFCSGKIHKFAKGNESAFVTPSFLVLKVFPGEVLSTSNVSEDSNEEKLKKNLNQRLIHPDERLCLRSLNSRTHANASF